MITHLQLRIIKKQINNAIALIFRKLISDLLWSSMALFLADSLPTSIIYPLSFLLYSDHKINFKYYKKQQIS